MRDSRALFTIGAFAIIFDEARRVLLCHRRDMDAWNLPGGGMVPGERPDECVIREVHEETGLEVAIERLVGVYSKTRRNELVFAFTCRITGGTLVTTDESDALAYFPIDQIPENTLHKHIERIGDAAALLNPQVIADEAMIDPPYGTPDKREGGNSANVQPVFKHQGEA